MTTRNPHAPGRFGNIAGALLVGGGSTRMGRDKAHVEVGGVAMATRLAGLLASIVEDVVLVGGNPPEDAPGRRVSDPEPADEVAVEQGRSSLRGLVGALDATSADRVLVVATDTPLLSADLLLALTAFPAHDAVVVEDADGRIHPLCGIYRREVVLPLAHENLAAGNLVLRALLDAVDTKVFGGTDLAAVDPDGTALMNINTPEELERARALLAQ